MGFEYQLHCQPRSPQQIQAIIVDMLNSDPAYRLLENDKQVTFQFTDLPQYSNWPENAAIIVDRESVYIVFYSGHRNHQERCLAQIREALNAKEIVTALEEI